MLKDVRQEGARVTEQSSKKRVTQWLEQCVVGLSLCPYARAPVAGGKVRLSVCPAATASALVALVLDEARELLDSEKIETTLVIAPTGFEDFLYFNDVSGDVEDALSGADLDQDFQLACFHPDYLFAGEDACDPAHFTNRAPFPIVQLLRVSTVARAVDSGDTLLIPEHNIARLRSLSSAELRVLFPWSAHWIDD
jgi:hypothetical protein